MPLIATGLINELVAGLGSEGAICGFTPVNPIWNVTGRNDNGIYFICYYRRNIEGNFIKHPSVILIEVFRSEN